MWVGGGTQHMGRMQVTHVVASQLKLTGDDRETDQRGARYVGVVLSLADLAHRIRTGCVYEGQPEETVGLLVTRDDPRERWRTRLVQAPIRAHWRRFAPSMALLTGASQPCSHSRHTRCQHERQPAALGWEGFAAAYRAELERWPFLVQLAVVRQIASWLCSYRTVTILSFEPSQPRGAALEAWERRGEFVPWAQRHVFREWLLGLPPIGLCVVGGAPAMERRVLLKEGVMVR
jgi:hypothetical protein